MPRVSELSISHEELRRILYYDKRTGVFSWKVSLGNRARVGAVAGTVMNTGYVAITVCKETVSAHVLAWFYVTGSWPAQHIDHINRQRRDNAWSNLREVTRSQNALNARIRSHNTSGYKGVSWYSRDKTWRAEIVVEGRTVHLGYFPTAVQASLARKAAEVTYGISDYC